MLPACLAEDVDRQRAGWLPRATQDHAGVGLADARLAQIRNKRGVTHTPMSQIVIIASSPKHHNLCVATHCDVSHIVSMSDGDKNGGPNNLRAWREYRKMSQAALAEAVGTNPNMIGYLESGERALSAKWLRRLAPELDTTPGMILDHDPFTLDNDLIDIWATASNRQRKQLLDIAKALVGGVDDPKTGTDGN